MLYIKSNIQMWHDGSHTFINITTLFRFFTFGPTNALEQNIWIPDPNSTELKLSQGNCSRVTQGIDRFYALLITVSEYVIFCYMKPIPNIDSYSIEINWLFKLNMPDCTIWGCRQATVVQILWDSAWKGTEYGKPKYPVSSGMGYNPKTYKLQCKFKSDETMRLIRGENHTWEILWTLSIKFGAQLCHE